MPPISQLAEQLTGRVIGPDDADYDAARRVFYGAVDRRPAAIARAAGTDDVARAIAFAREHDLELAVRSGGHSPAGHSVCEGGLVLDLAGLSDLQIDADCRVAWTGAGLTTGAYTTAAAAHGLATGFGDTGSVGIGGITVAGGVGFLVRKHGMTIDHLLAADVVTAGGETLRVDAENHPDLFWAIRGGGGNAGVVTRLQLRLQEVGTIVGGMLVLPATPEVVTGFMAESEAAPEELSAIVNVMTAPPMPFLPAELHGKPIVMALMTYAGPLEDGDRVYAPFRALAEPIADMIRPIPYAEMFGPEPEDYRPIAAARTMFAHGVDHAAAEAILDQLSSSTASMAVTQLRVLGGAMARVPSEATAFAHRQSRMMVNVAALYERPEQRPEHEAWVAKLAARLDTGDSGAYVGFLGDEGDERVRAAYPEPTWRRLAAVKAQYDPDNFFRLNQNVPPAKREESAAA